MCLFADSGRTAELLKRSRPIRAWKVLYFPDGGNLRSLFRGDFVWKPGINRSNSRARKAHAGDGPIGRGIHVYLSREVATREIRSYEREDKRVVPVTCEVKHLIASNFSGTQAVFTKVHLSKQAYSKAMKP